MLWLDWSEEIDIGWGEMINANKVQEGPEVKCFFSLLFHLNTCFLIRFQSFQSPASKFVVEYFGFTQIVAR